MYSAYMNIYVSTLDHEGRRLPERVFMTRQNHTGRNGVRLYQCQQNINGERPGGVFELVFFYAGLVKLC